MAEPSATRLAALCPAIAEAARRAGADRLGLIDLGGGDGTNLEVDRVAITYDDGTTLGDPSSAVRLSCAVKGDRAVPPRPVPAVVTRDGLDLPALHRLPDVIAGVPAGALPVVLTTWALSRMKPARRPELLHRLDEAAAHRTVAWVSIEGVGVAPGVPTLGDRPASGHSIIGVTVVDGEGRHAEAIGRCWSRGRWMSWLVD